MVLLVNVCTITGNNRLRTDLCDTDIDRSLIHPVTRG